MDNKITKNENEKNKELEIPSIELLKEELEWENSRYNFRKTLWNIAVVLLVAAAITALTATRLFALIRINGSSMTPALADGEIVFIRQTKDVGVGDIIGFYYGGKVLLKRAIAGEGDEVEIDKEGNVFVNGEQIEEPYLAEKHLGKCEIQFPYTVPEGMLFVLGDNRAISIDSRNKTIGCVESDQIVGKVAFRAWPLARMGIVR